MGLLLSVLVTCVGVVELLTFYNNFKRRVNPQPIETNLNAVKEQYLRELEDVRDRLIVQLRSLKSGEVFFTSANIPTVRPNSHKDIDNQFNDNTVARSRYISPHPLLDTKKENSSTLLARKFLVSEEPQELQGIKKTKAQKSLAEYRIKEQTTSSVPRYIFKDDNGSLPLFLEENLLVSEHEEEVKLVELKKKSGHNIGGEDGELYHRKSSFPFHSFDITAPRNSVCSEILKGSVSVKEVNELSGVNLHSPVNAETTYESNNNLEINNNSEKMDVILNSSTYNSLEYWDNKALVMPSKKCKSRSPSPGILQKQTADSLLKPNFQQYGPKSVSDDEDFTSNFQTCSKISSRLEFSEKVKDSLAFKNGDENEELVKVQMYTEEVKNSLDGIKKGKGCIKKKIVRKKRIKNRATSENITDLSGANNSVDPKDLPIENDVNTSPITKKENRSDIKTGEPFWLIFSGEYTKAMNKDFHGQHFCCWQCDESLTGQRYVLRDDHPYCVSCYESVFANACEKCSRTIGIDSKDLSYKDKHWHEACFLCTTCGESLVDKQFGSKGDRIYCGRCYDEQFASKCDGCHEIFRAGTKKMEYKTRQWHEKCFCCCVCKVPIGTQSFIPREQEIFCAKCYEEKFATRCIKCNKVITSGGVTYKNEPWHRECFTCTNCQKSLAGERFTSRDEKPYCADCFGELFAKRCFACNKPITGIGGTKFISFEDRHWHNDCFFCASCRTSLVGRGFITDQEDIICPECAKQKLM